MTETHNLFTEAELIEEFKQELPELPDNGETPNEIFWERMIHIIHISSRGMKTGYACDDFRGEHWTKEEWLSIDWDLAIRVYQNSRGQTPEEKEGGNKKGRMLYFRNLLLQDRVLKESTDNLGNPFGIPKLD